MGWPKHEIDWDTLHAKVRALLEEAGGVDEDGDPRLEFTLIDRLTHERLRYRPVRYDYAVSEEERRLAMDDRFHNLQAANEDFQRAYRYDESLRLRERQRREKREQFGAELLWSPGEEEGRDVRMQAAAEIRSLVPGAKFFELPVLEVGRPGSYDLDYFMVASDDIAIWHHKHLGYEIWRLPQMPSGKALDELPLR